MLSKYLIAENEAIMHPIIMVFDEWVVHSMAAKALPPNSKVTGAGSFKRRRGQVTTSGYSDSLNIGPHPDDALTLTIALL